MNKTYFYLVILIQLITTSAWAKVAPEERVKGTAQNYIATARYSQPLTSFERCIGPNIALTNSDVAPYIREWPGTRPGIMAYTMALSEALSICQNEYNSECRAVSAGYREIISMELLGYKACEAKVVVRGYKFY